MLNMVKGCRVPFPERLSEGYIIQDGRIIANINAEKIMDLFNHYIVLHKDESAYFILELPVKKDEEKEVRPGVVETTHKHVYYIDGINADEALTILLRDGELLINDGISNFGFGYQTGDEMMLDKYNVLIMFSPEIEQYAGFLESHKIHPLPEFKSAWNTFSQDHPGITMGISVDGKTVYDLVDQYKDWGIYLAETRED